MANEYGVGQIEITSPLVYSEPIRIESKEPLIIRSTVGGSLLIFQATGQPEATTPSLISIETNRVEFEDLHFRWDVPDGYDDGGIFIDLRGIHQLRMVRCSVTVKDSTQPDNIIGFNVRAGSSWRGFEALLPIARLARTTKIDLRNCVVRGGMDMLALDGNTDLQLTWDNGLLAIAGRMIDATGTKVAQQIPQQGAIELVLTRLTAHVPSGLVRVQASNDAPYPISVDRQSFNSLFFVDSRIPHFEFLGLSSLTSRPELLRLRGASNWYVIDRRGTDPMLKLETEDEESQVTAINDIQANRPDWFRDPSPRWTANPWADSALESIEPADRTTENYRQENPAAAGFDLESMPKIPEFQIPEPQSPGFAPPTNKLSIDDGGSKKEENTSIFESDLTFPLSSDLIGEPRDLNRLP